jgi:hypothetical protein
MTDESHDRAAIDWASAEVENAVLTVPLAGEPSKAWAERFEHVLAVLGEEGRRGPWESVDITRERVKVTGVQAGGEGDVRYVLEAVVTQTNADLAPDPDEGDDDEASTADQEMAAAFRAFAEKDEDD